MRFEGCKTSSPQCMCNTCKRKGTENCCDNIDHMNITGPIAECPDYEKEPDHCNDADSKN